MSFEVLQIPFFSPCVEVCPEKYYGNPETSECHPCDSSCEVCSGPLPTNCKSCKVGYHLTDNGRCSHICQDGFFMGKKFPTFDT